MHDFLSDNDLLSPKKLGFRLGDSSNQFRAVNHGILNAFDKELETVGFFCYFKGI